MTSYEKLKEIESSGLYLFHGSPHEIDVIESRQSRSANQDIWQKDVAIFAASDASLAVAYAILPIDRRAFGKYSIVVSINKEKITKISANRNIIEHLGEGVVYVIPKEGFEEHPDGQNYKRKDAVKPEMKLKVTVDDFLKMGGIIVELPTANPLY